MRDDGVAEEGGSGDAFDAPEVDVLADAPEAASDDTPAETPDEPAETAEKKEDAPVVPPPAGEDDDFSKVAERDATGRFNRIPHPRVKKMVEGAVKKAETAWTEREKAYQAKTTTYETRLADIAQVENIMFNDPQRMLGILRTIPGYAEIFDRAPEAGRAADAGDSKTPVMDPNNPPPGPDYTDPQTGQKGYTPEGLQKLLDHTAGVAAARAIRETEDRIGKRIKPFEDAASKRQRLAEEEARVNSELDEAVKWEGFMEHIDGILGWMETERREAAAAGRKPTDSRTALNRAYREVVMKARTVQREKLWAEFQTTLKGSPKSTAAGSAQASGKAPAKPLSVDDQIKANLRKMRQD